MSSAMSNQPQPGLATTPVAQTAHWIAAWYAAPTRMLPAALSGRTIRQIAHVHAGGEQARVRLSNRYGAGPVTLTAVSVGQALQGPLVAPGARAVQFGGQPSVTLAPGQEIVSDPVALRVAAFSDLAITFFLAQGESLTGHSYAQQTSYLSGAANVTALPAEATMFMYPLQTTSYWLLTGVDVAPAGPLNAVVTFGSSTTDGVGSTPNANSRWPDVLARRLRDAGGDRFMSVVNAGIGGNQLTSSDIVPAGGAGLSSLSSLPPLPPGLFGEAGSQRLAWDALAQPGATDLIIHIGSNDLRFGVAGARLIEALQQVAQQARPTYRKVFGTTILPGGYSPEQAAQRQIVNAWLREQGARWFDAVFEFAAPLAAPDDEAKLNPAFDSGDGIHPNDAGYRLMAAAVDITLLSGSPDQAP